MVSSQVGEHIYILEVNVSQLQGGRSSCAEDSPDLILLIFSSVSSNIPFNKVQTYFPEFCEPI